MSRRRRKSSSSRRRTAAVGRGALAEAAAGGGGATAAAAKGRGAAAASGVGAAEAAGRKTAGARGGGGWGRNLMASWRRSWPASRSQVSSRCYIFTGDNGEFMRAAAVNQEVNMTLSDIYCRLSTPIYTNTGVFIKCLSISIRLHTPVFSLFFISWKFHIQEN
jgi:hypothetical protein